MAVAPAHPRRSGVVRALEQLGLGVLPVLLTLGLFVAYYDDGSLAIDFHRQYWVVGDRILHGLDPYALEWQRLRNGVGFPYSAFDALVFTPVALIPHRLADVLMSLALIAAVLATLRLLGVRDWRVLGLVLLWTPTISAWQTGNVTAFLLLGLAVAWRQRDRPAVVGPLIGLLVTVKLFVWPVGIWLLATRRWRALLIGVPFGIVLNVVSWAIVGFDQIELYREVVSEVAKFDDDRAYSIVSLALNAGASHPLAYLLGYGVAGAVALGAFAAGARRDDRAAFLLALAAAMLAAPVIWLHYFVLLAIPLALSSRRLEPVWCLPFIALAVAAPVTDPSVLQIAVALLMLGAVFAAALRRSAPPAPAAA